MQDMGAGQDQSRISKRGWRIRLAISGGVIVSIALAGVLLFAADAKSVKSANTPNGSVPTSIAGFLDQPELAETAGHLVFLNDVRMEQGPTPEVMIAHDGAGRSVLVDVSEVKSQVPSGAIADVMGTITPLPRAATMRKSWKLSKEEASARQKDGIYIEANLVRPKE